jgi:hypothetical protein
MLRKSLGAYVQIAALGDLGQFFYNMSGPQIKSANRKRICLTLKFWRKKLPRENLVPTKKLMLCLAHKFEKLMPSHCLKNSLRR